jgi:hypothetical protein
VLDFQKFVREAGNPSVSVSWNLLDIAVKAGSEPLVFFLLQKNATPHFWTVNRGEACLEGCRLGEGGLVGEEVQPRREGEI